MMNLENLHENCEQVSEHLKALGHPTRLAILCLLADGRKTVGELTNACGAAQSVVSQFLMRLRGEGIVSAEKSGQHVFYEICDARTLKLMRALQSIFCESQTETLSN